MYFGEEVVVSKYRTPLVVNNDFFSNIIERLTHNDPAITWVSFRGKTLTTEQIKSLSEAIKNNPYLKVLDLGFCQIENEGLNILTHTLQSNQSIERLDLRGIKNFTDSSIHSLTQWLKSSQTLNALIMNECGLSKERIEKILMELSEKTEWQELDLSLNMEVRYMDISILNKFILSNPKLKMLQIKNNWLSHESLAAILKNTMGHPSLEHLNIAGNAYIDPVESFPKDQQESLQKILTGAVLKIIENPGKLKYLNLSDLFLSEDFDFFEKMKSLPGVDIRANKFFSKKQKEEMIQIVKQHQNDTTCQNSLVQAWGTSSQASWKELVRSAIDEAKKLPDDLGFEYLYRFLAWKRSEISRLLGHDHRPEERWAGNDQLFFCHYGTETPFGFIRTDSHMDAKMNMATNVYGGRYSDFSSYLEEQVNQAAILIKTDKEINTFVFPKGHVVLQVGKDAAGQLDYLNIIHPKGELFGKKLDLLEKLHKEILSNDGSDCIVPLAKMLRELSHIMPSTRGSASIVEIMLTYYSEKKNLNLNYISRIPLDLEAIFSSEWSFMAKFIGLFESNPRMDNRIIQEYFLKEIPSLLQETCELDDTFVETYKTALEISQDNRLPHEQKINLMFEAITIKMNFEPKEGETQENLCARICSTLFSHKLKLEQQREEEIKMSHNQPTKTESQSSHWDDNNKNTFFNEKNAQSHDPKITIELGSKKNNNLDEMVGITLSDEEQSLLPQKSNSCCTLL